jgi:hypothetical protein
MDFELQKAVVLIAIGNVLSPAFWSKPDEFGIML